MENKPSSSMNAFQKALIEKRGASRTVSEIEQLNKKIFKMPDVGKTIESVIFKRINSKSQNSQLDNSTSESPGDNSSSFPSSVKE